VGRSLEADVPADIVMENVAEKLKLLGYEKEFCRRKRPFWTPVSRSHFAVAAPPGSGDQFFYFTSLLAWLLNKAGRNFSAPEQSDDPNSTCTSILNELKALGFAAPSFPPAKLKQGYGDAVCGVLDGVLDLVLERVGWKWQKAVYQPDGYAEEAEIDDSATASHAAGAGHQAAPEPNSIDDLVGAGKYDDEEEAYMGGQLAAEGGGATLDEDHKPLESRIDAAEWRLELERVGPQLRVTVVSDNKDWRSHLEQTHAHHETIEKALPESKSQLDKVEVEVTSALEKISTREKFVNNQLEHLTSEYRAVREQLEQVQQRYNKTTENVAELTSELGHISEELEQVKQTMADREDNIGDTKPLVRIKAAISKLKTELKAMEVKIGVAEHSLLQTQLKNKDSVPSERMLQNDYESDEG